MIITTCLLAAGNSLLHDMSVLNKDKIQLRKTALLYNVDGTIL